MIAWIFLSCFSPKKVKALRVQGAAEGLTLCPGERTPIVVRARQTNGRLRTTDGRRRDRLRWDDVVVRMNERNFEDGRIWLPQDPRESLNAEYTLEVFLVDRPEMAVTTTVRPRYDCRYVADFSGQPGESGENTALFQRSGWDGDDGGHGGPGGEAAAYVNAMEHNGSTLLQVRVTGTRNGQPLNRCYLLDPDGGSLTVNVSGGPGGTGGSGNDGEDGDDADVNDNGEQGWGEDGENGGDGGDGGAGGQGWVVLDPAVEKYADRFHVDARGGAPGSGGRPGDGGEGGDGDPAGDWGDDGRWGRDGHAGPDGPDGIYQVEPVKPSF